MSEPMAMTTRAPRWMWIVLIASLAINLLGLGIAAGTFWQIQSARATADDPPPRGLVEFADTLPAARGDAIRDAVRTAQAAMNPLRQEVRRARSEARQVFGSEPFDKDKFAVAHTRVAAAAHQVRQAYLRLLTDIGDKMSAEERRRFLDWRKQYRSRWQHWAEEDREDARGKGGNSNKQ